MTTATALTKPFTHVTAVLGFMLTFLEKVSDENIWKNVLGERLVNLLQKYFGNDFVTLSLAFYLAPILRTNWATLMEKICKKVQPPGTVCIKIYSDDNLYNTVSKYAFEHGAAKDNFVTGIAQYYSSSDSIATCVDEYDIWGDEDTKYSENDDDDDNQLKVKLRPPENFDEELEYKGHKIKIEFKETSTKSGSEVELEHIVVSMEGSDTKKLHVILQEWSDEYNKTTRTRYIYRPYTNYWNTDKEVPYRGLDSIHLRDGQKEHLLMDLQTFRSRSDWYTKRGIPYRRGYLLYGPPGTGKSSTIQAVAKHLDYNIAIISTIASTSNDTFAELIKSVPYNTIIVIEDVDHLFKSVTDSKVDAKMTMSGLLNIMDGMQSHNGSIIFMTCNNMIKLEPALLRPGRIDVKLKFGYASIDQIKESFWRFMGLDDKTSMPLSNEDREIAETHVNEFVKMIPEDEITTAELQSFFIDLLLEAEAGKWERSHTYKIMYERIPDFLNKVQLDREQAEKHEEEEKEKK